MKLALKNIDSFSVLKAKDSEYDFIVANKTWLLSRDVKLDFSKFEKCIKPSLYQMIKHTLANVALTLSSAYTRKLFYSLNKLLMFNKFKLEELETSLLNRFYNAFYKTDYTHVESLKYFIIKLNSLYPNYLDKTCFNNITQWKIIKTNQSSTKTELSVSERPLSESELIKIISGATELYDKGKIRFNDYLLTLLLIYTGMRPMQISMLKIGDLFIKNNENYINMSRIKQGRRFRTEFSEIKLSSFFIEKLNELKMITTVCVEYELNKKLDVIEVSKLPLFINNYFFSSDYSNQNISHDDYECLHMNSKKVTARLQYVCHKLNIQNIHCRRLRSSLATRIALHGYHPQVIARVLDHTSLRCIGSYAKNNQEYAKRINDAINHKIRNYAILFLNKQNQTNDILINEINSIREILNYMKEQASSENTPFKVSYISLLERDLDRITKMMNTGGANE